MIVQYLWLFKFILSISSMFKKIAKVRIDGIIDLQAQHHLIQVVNKLYKSSFVAIAVIINSYGGSIKSAKAISNLLKTYRDQKYSRVPIYCFAEDFCLNSANLVLSMGTKSFANKLSMIGDFGFYRPAYDIDQFQKQFRVGEIQISKMNKSKIKNWPSFYPNIVDQKFLDFMVNQSFTQLSQGIVENRLNRLKIIYSDLKQFEDKVLSQSIIDPEQAMKLGFIDQMASFQEFKYENYPKVKISQRNMKRFSNPTMNMAENILNLLQNK